MGVPSSALPKRAENPGQRVSESSESGTTAEQVSLIRPSVDSVERAGLGSPGRNVEASNS